MSNRDELMQTAKNTIPFLMEDSLIQRLENNDKSVSSTTNNDSAVNNSNDFNDLLPVDMDMDSPFSPQSSEGSDIFEPPMPTQNTPGSKKRKANGNVSSSTKSHKAGKKGKGKLYRFIFWFYYF